MDKSKSNGGVGKITSLISTIISRADLGNRAGLTFEGKRDLYAALGYDRVLDYVKYWERYQRGGIAARIIDALPTATWRNPPIISVKGNEAFDKAWNDLAQRLALFHYLERVDKLAGVGRYAVLFLGVSGGRGSEAPLQEVKGPEGLLFLTLFSEINADIKELERSPSSPRFGLPLIYNVRFVNGIGIDARELALPTHASRMIHIADGKLEDDVFGAPRLKKVWNYLDDLDKVIGGSAEAIWKTVDRGMQFDLDKELNLSDDEEEAFEDEIEEYMHGMSRFFKTKGVTVKTLGTDVPDPRGPVEAIMGLISGTTGIPQRILMGSERGELSSGQDERNFNSRVRERQLSYAEPVILRPLLNRLISINVLPAPGGEIIITWPDLTITSDKEAADIAARTGQAIKHVSDQANMVMPPKLFATEYLGIDPDVYDKAVKEAEPLNPPKPVVEEKIEEEDKD